MSSPCFGLADSNQNSASEVGARCDLKNLFCQPWSSSCHDILGHPHIIIWLLGDLYLSDAWSFLVIGQLVIHSHVI